jgi:hypothetical protein
MDTTAVRPGAVLKINLGGDVRRVAVLEPATFTFRSLCSIVSDLFPGLPSQYTLKYHDDRGGEIVAGSDAEIESFNVAHADGRTFRVIIESSSQATASPEVTASIIASSPYMWISTTGATKTDEHVAFRGKFTLSADASVQINHVCVSWYNLYVDGVRTAEGPTRFMGNAPYYDCTTIKLKAGAHVIGIHAHNCGEQTRFLLKRPPVAFCTVQSAAGSALPLTWRCTELSNYKSQWKRLSALLGWAEQCSVDKLLLSWPALDFDDSKWIVPGELTAQSTLIQFNKHKPADGFSSIKYGLFSSLTALFSDCFLV